MKKMISIKKLTFFSILILFGLTLEANAFKPKVFKATAIRVLSYNIRYKNTIDSINGWEYRKDKVVGLIKYHNADLIGMQEAEFSQVRDLELMLPDFAWYGVGRIDGKEKGESCAIFYRKSRLKLLDSGTFWLSEEPNIIGTKSWDSFFPRVASWGKFKDLYTGKIFFHFNTHYDHRGEIARQKSSELLVKKVNSLAGNLPVFVTGDFNTINTSIAYKNIVENTSLFDAHFISKEPHYGPKGTSSGFLVKGNVDRKIDYIFVNSQISVIKHAVLSEQQEGRYYSDHLPVIIEALFK